MTTNSKLRALLAEALPELKERKYRLDAIHGIHSDPAEKVALLIARITAALAEKEDGGDKVVCPCCKGSKKVDRVSFVDPTKTIKNSCHICRGKGYLINDASHSAGKEGVR